MWQIIIPKWCPPSKNAWRGKHWWASDASTKACTNFLTHYAKIAAVPFVRSPETYRPCRTVKIAVYKKGRLLDPSNLLDSLLDGMKRAKLIVDDSQKYCICEMPWMTSVQNAQDAKTVITIMDIPHECDRTIF